MNTSCIAVSTARFSSRLLLLLTFTGLFVATVAAGTLDGIVMGNEVSEKTHGLVAVFPPPVATKDRTSPLPSDPSATPPSDVITGGLGLSARRLLGRTPNGDMYGGELTFTLKVDPVNQNYFSIKLWGDDRSEDTALLLYCENFEIGTRHGNAATDLFVNHGGAWFPGRFWYRTATLPLKLTKGKTSVNIRLRSAGKIYDYNNRHGKSYIPDYQHVMKQPSWSIYAVFTHLGGYVDPSGIASGTAPVIPIRTTSGPELMDEWKKSVSSKAANLLKAKGMRISDLEYLAQCSEVAWTPVFQKKEVADTLVRCIDDYAKGDAADPKLRGTEWGGSYGPIGNALAIVAADLQTRLDEMVDFGGSVGQVTRRQGWSKMLRGSVDFGRFNRRALSNQEMACAIQIFSANRGLLAIDPANALAEKEALRYLYEASGLLPFLGNDQPGGGPVPVRGADTKDNRLWYGPNWFTVTAKGLTKEPSFVGADYGEQGAVLYTMGRLAKDRRLMDRAIEMIRARTFFRFPSLDDEGFRVMMSAAPIGCRNNYLPGHYVYLTRESGAEMIARENLPDLTGCFQQQLADGQLYKMLTGGSKEVNRRAGAVGAAYLPDDLAAALAKPPVTGRMPTAPGAPDFAWGDEENMCVAAKHGEELFFTNMVWRGPTSINRCANVFLVTPTAAARAEIQLDDIRYVPTGTYATGTGSVDSFDRKNPPDNKQYPNAEIGTRTPIAVRPDLAGQVPTRNQDAGRGTGYTLCYGPWLVGMNGRFTTGDYTMKLPPGFTSAKDLVSGKTLTAPIVIPQATTVVFYLSKPATIPTSPDTTPNPEEKP